MPHTLPLLLGQTDDPGSWLAWLAANALGVTVFLIFGGAILSAVLTQWRRDKCLKLLRGDHATVAKLDGTCLWGDLIVYPKALELTFDAPYITSRGIVKSGVLLPEADVTQLHLVARSEAGLTAKEAAHRKKQIRRTFRPGFPRRWLRVVRNLVNTLRDAFAKAFSAVLSAVTRNPQAAALADQKGSVEGIGQQLIGAAGNAYDPMLEAHVGRPVVVSLRCPGLSTPDKPVSVDVPGYLVDYTEAYLAVFNVDHAPLRTLEVSTSAGEGEAAGDPGLTRDAYGRVCIRNPGPAFLLVRAVDEAGGATADLDAAVPPGATLRLTGAGEGPVTVRVDVTERLDLVIPRSQAAVRHGGDREEDPRAEARRRPRGVAPREGGGPETDG